MCGEKRKHGFGVGVGSAMAPPTITGCRVLDIVYSFLEGAWLYLFLAPKDSLRFWQTVLHALRLGHKVFRSIQRTPEADFF